MPPAIKLCESVYQWTIYDSYVKLARENVQKRREAERKSDRSKKKKTTQTVLTYQGTAETVNRNRILNHPRAKLLADMLDRIVVQNCKVLTV